MAVIKNTLISKQMGKIRPLSSPTTGKKSSPTAFDVQTRRKTDFNIPFKKGYKYSSLWWRPKKKCISFYTSSPSASIVIHVF